MTTNETTLALYVRDYCLFCHRVLRTVDQLGLQIDIRNIWQDQEHEQELLSATGRGTVPVLKIDKGGEPAEWMPESAEIIRYLKQQSGAA